MCPGQGECDWCASPNLAYAPLVNEKIKSVFKSLMANTTTSSDPSERSLTLIKGMHRNFAPELFENTEESLKPTCPSVDDKYIQGNITFALADIEK
ncbi:MAG: hypothetical protein NPIRA01_16740 [Nitrospirales bacterium]|nr:MAG: hypothetical protein NPIRA01_16740 [Nitrospirales bacterium]